MLQLPNELILEIAELLDTQTSLNHLAQVNRYLYNLLNPYLYSENGRAFRSTALLWAAQHGKLRSAQLALEAGANLSHMDEEGLTPLSLACLYDQTDVSSAEYRHIEIVKLLLSNDSTDPNSPDVYGRSALWYAAFRGRATLVSMLLSHPGLERNSVDKSNWTPLQCAAAVGHSAVVELLLASRADANCADNFRRTPLIWAACHGHAESVDVLLRNGANAEARDRFGRTALSFAAANGRTSVTQRLLRENIVDIDSKDSSGRTPLSWAAGGGHAGAVNLLISAGAALSLSDSHGWTPLSYAVVEHHRHVAFVLCSSRVPVELSVAERHCRARYRTNRKLSEYSKQWILLCILKMSVSGN